MASPFPIALPDHPDDLIVPAREGTLHVLRAATESGVQRVVVTSSMAAVVYGLTSTPAQPMTETRWTDPEGNDDHTPYILSKFYAERAAWDFVRDTPGAPDLATVNPGAVLGPLLADNASDSLLMVTKMLNGEFPGVPKLGFEVVDVRDVADLHIRSMEAPEAAGERFLAVAGFRTMREIADVLREAVPERAKKLPKVTLPDWVVRVFARFDADTRGALSELGKRRIASSEKAQRVLGWAPRSPDEAVRASARDVVSRGLIG
ncbi:MAG: NAD-dependent epimerase/dehydratase family protein [Bacteroidota bacterium]